MGNLGIAVRHLEPHLSLPWYVTSPPFDVWVVLTYQSLVWLPVLGRRTMHVSHASVMGSQPRETHPQHDPRVDRHDIRAIRLLLHLLHRHAPVPMDQTAPNTKVLLLC